MINTI